MSLLPWEPLMQIPVGQPATMLIAPVPLARRYNFVEDAAPPQPAEANPPLPAEANGAEDGGKVRRAAGPARLLALPLSICPPSGGIGAGARGVWAGAQPACTSAHPRLPGVHLSHSQLT